MSVPPVPAAVILDPLSIVGLTIDGKYLIEQLVGEGGFGFVYRAIHTVWRRRVAIKFLKVFADLTAEHREGILQDFVKEGALLAELSARSSGIVQAYDVGSWPLQDGTSIPYIVLQWLEGKTLQQ